MGSSSCELNESAQVISYEEYHPFGSTSFHTVDSGAEVSAKRYRYTGKERDDETGLYYYGARYYACRLGRWLSCDKNGAQGDGNNLYQFVSNNPIIKVDPDGNEPVTITAVVIYLGKTAVETTAETSIEAGIAKVTKDEKFSYGWSYAKNFAVNAVVGLIPGATEAKIGAKAALYSTK